MSKIGIDLGSYNTAGAVVRASGQVDMIESKEGKSPYGKHFPSFVRFDNTGELRDVGLFAQGELANNPDLVVWGVKRLIGLPFDQIEATGEIKRFQYIIERSKKDGRAVIKINGRFYTPTQISSYILEKVKNDAQSLKQNGITSPVDGVVITVPAFFDGSRVAEVKAAGFAAGFKDVRILAEPTAAAIAYGMQGEKKDQTLLVFDLGAGTLDIVVAHIIISPENEFIPSEGCISGHEALGGIDMDDAIITYLTEKHNLGEVKSNTQSLMNFRRAIETAKIKLSNPKNASADISFSFPSRDVDITLISEEMEEAFESEEFQILTKCKKCLEQTLRDAEEKGYSKNNIDHVIFIGGPTRLLVIRNIVKDAFSGNTRIQAEIDKITTAGFPINPLEAVARGAALVAAGKVDPISISAFGYGTIVKKGYFGELIPHSATLPCKHDTMLAYVSQSILVAGVEVIKKIHDPERSGDPKYIMLGMCFLPITPSSSPGVEILTSMILTRDRELQVELAHRHDTGMDRIKFEKLETLDGQEIPLGKDDIEIVVPPPPPDTRKKAKWTSDHRKKLNITVKAVLGISSSIISGKNLSLANKSAALGAMICKDSGNQNTDCPKIMIAAFEFVNLLHAEGCIQEKDYNRYIFEIKNISDS